MTEGVRKTEHRLLLVRRKIERWEVLQEERVRAPNCHHHEEAEQSTLFPPSDYDSKQQFDSLDSIGLLLSLSFFFFYCALLKSDHLP